MSRAAHNVDLNHSKTDCHPQTCQCGSGITEPLPNCSANTKDFNI